MKNKNTWQNYLNSEIGCPSAEDRKNTFVLNPEKMKGRKVAYSYEVSAKKGLDKYPGYYDAEKQPWNLRFPKMLISAL